MASAMTRELAASVLAVVALALCLAQAGAMDAGARDPASGESLRLDDEALLGSSEPGLSPDEAAQLRADSSFARDAGFGAADEVIKEEGPLDDGGPSEYYVKTMNDGKTVDQSSHPMAEVDWVLEALNEQCDEAVHDLHKYSAYSLLPWKKVVVTSETATLCDQRAEALLNGGQTAFFGYGEHRPVPAGATRFVSKVWPDTCSGIVHPAIAAADPLPRRDVETTTFDRVLLISDAASGPINAMMELEFLFEKSGYTYIPYSSEGNDGGRAGQDKFAWPSRCQDKQKYFTIMTRVEPVEILKNPYMLNAIAGVDFIVVAQSTDFDLANVVTGVTNKPTVTFATSEGGWATQGGRNGFEAMLDYCNAGVAVVNIDSSLGAWSWAVTGARFRRKAVLNRLLCRQVDGTCKCSGHHYMKASKDILFRKDMYSVPPECPDTEFRAAAAEYIGTSHYHNHLCHLMEYMDYEYEYRVRSLDVHAPKSTFTTAKDLSAMTTTFLTNRLKQMSGWTADGLPRPGSSSMTSAFGKTDTQLALAMLNNDYSPNVAGEKAANVLACFYSKCFDSDGSREARSCSMDQYQKEREYIAKRKTQNSIRALVDDFKAHCPSLKQFNRKWTEILNEKITEAPYKCERILKEPVLFDPLSKMLYRQDVTNDDDPKKNNGYYLGKACVVSAGIADQGILRAIVRVFNFNGIAVQALADLGVNSIAQDTLKVTRLVNSCDLFIATAGMEGTLPEVVAQVARGAPVISVPSNIGYGAHREGMATLGAMASYPTPGMIVTNIDAATSAVTIALSLMNAHFYKRDKFISEVKNINEAKRKCDPCGVVVQSQFVSADSGRIDYSKMMTTCHTMGCNYCEPERHGRAGPVGTAVCTSSTTSYDGAKTCMTPGDADAMREIQRTGKLPPLGLKKPSM